MRNKNEFNDIEIVENKTNNEREGANMVAMLWAQQIMLGRRTYKQVPRLLKEKVKQILIDSGYEELVVED